MFPPPNETLRSFEVFGCIFSLAMVLVPIGVLVLCARRRMLSRSNVVPMCIPVLIGAAGLFVALRPLIRDISFRRAFAPEEVTGILVFRIADEYGEPIGGQAQINQPAVIDQGLHGLESAVARQRNHESFSDGYCLVLLTKNSKRNADLRIFAFRKSSRYGGVSIVIVGIERGASFGGYEYSCPAFHSWIRANVDPLFADGGD